MPQLASLASPPGPPSEEGGNCRNSLRSHPPLAPLLKKWGIAATRFARIPPLAPLLKKRGIAATRFARIPLAPFLKKGEEAIERLDNPLRIQQSHKTSLMIRTPLKRPVNQESAVRDWNEGHFELSLQHTAHSVRQLPAEPCLPANCSYFTSVSRITPKAAPQFAACRASQVGRFAQSVCQMQALPWLPSQLRSSSILPAHASLRTCLACRGSFPGSRT